MSFYSENFYLNDVSNIDMGVVLVSMNSDVLMDYGIKYKESLQVEMSRNNHFYYSQNAEVDTFTLTVALVDRFGNPKEWTIDDRTRIVDWFVTKDFIPFISCDDNTLIYYLKCVEYTKKFNAIGQGVMEFVMQPESKYVHTPITHHTYVIKGERDINIKCLDNVNDRYYPKMEIIQLDKGKQSIEISNLTFRSDSFIVNNLMENERVEIDHLLKSINSNMETYKLKDINRKWFYLKRGLNKIRIKGNCEIRITVQFQLKV